MPPPARFSISSDPIPSSVPSPSPSLPPSPAFSLPSPLAVLYPIRPPSKATDNFFLPAAPLSLSLFPSFSVPISGHSPLFLFLSSGASLFLLFFPPLLARSPLPSVHSAAPRSRAHLSSFVSFGPTNIGLRAARARARAAGCRIEGVKERHPPSVTAQYADRRDGVRGRTR